MMSSSKVVANSAVDAEKDHSDPKRDDEAGDDDQVVLSIASSSGGEKRDQEGQEQIIGDDHEKIDDKLASTSSPPSIVDEDDDGFRTPTSTAHRIPEPQQCPPAPKKHRPTSNKRKASDSGHRSQQIQVITLPEDLSSIFPSLHRDHLGHKIKKARSDDR